VRSRLRLCSISILHFGRRHSVAVPSYRLRVAIATRRIEIWLRGLASDLFSRSSSFSYFFWTATSNENKLLGGARDAPKRVIKLTRTRYWAAPKGRGKNEWQRQQILDCAEVRGERINDKQQKSNCKQQQQGRTTEMGGLRWCAGLVPCAREFLGTNPCAPETPTCAQCTRRSKQRQQAKQKSIAMGTTWVDGLRCCAGLVLCTRGYSSAPTRVPRRPPLMRSAPKRATTVYGQYKIFSRIFEKWLISKLRTGNLKMLRKFWRHKRLVSKTSSSSTRIVQEQQQYMDSTRIIQEFSKSGVFEIEDRQPKDVKKVLET